SRFRGRKRHVRIASSSVASSRDRPGTDRPDFPIESGLSPSAELGHSASFTDGGAFASQGRSGVRELLLALLLARGISATLDDDPPGVASRGSLRGTAIRRPRRVGRSSSDDLSHHTPSPSAHPRLSSGTLPGNGGRRAVLRRSETLALL